MKRLILFFVLLAGPAVAQSDGLPSLLPQLPSGLPPRVAEFGRLAFTSMAAVTCNLRNAPWSTQLYNYAYEAAIFKTGEQYQGYIPPNIEQNLINYMVDSMTAGLHFDVGSCGNLQGLLLGEADVAENQGILGN